jgi:hypothetical protein
MNLTALTAFADDNDIRMSDDGTAAIIADRASRSRGPKRSMPGASNWPRF